MFVSFGGISREILRMMNEISGTIADQVSLSIWMAILRKMVALIVIMIGTAVINR